MSSKTRTRRRRAPRGVSKAVHNRDRDAADQALSKRLREERRQEALEETRREQERLERRIEREKLQPAMGPTLGALYAHSEPELKPELEPVAPPLNDAPIVQPTPPVTHTDTPLLWLRFPDLPWEGEGNQPRAIGQARTMFRQGYHIRKVISTYDVGLKWFDDLPIDEMGFGAYKHLRSSPYGTKDSVGR